MTRQYSPKRFFRQAANRFLQQYFAMRNVPIQVDFAKLTETKIDPLYKAWLGLADSVRNECEQDFQEIDDLASEGGSKAIIDEGMYHDENLAPAFTELHGFHEHAFWTFLERPQFWPAAHAFYHADSLPQSYWRRRKNMPDKPVIADNVAVEAFEQALGDYFHTTQGRGKNCKVDCYKRNESYYFFAYPEDYAQASIEWENNEFKRRPHHPALEVIFVYTQTEGTLDIFLRGGRKPLPALQTIFAETILAEELTDDETDDLVYDLSPLRRRGFEFAFDADSGIASMAIKRLRLKKAFANERITIEADPSDNKDAIYDLLAEVTNNISLSQTFVTQASIQVTWQANPKTGKAKTYSFNVSYPNSCSLKHDERGILLRKVLADSGIEPIEERAQEGKVVAV